jgi:hypothetical protein
MLRAGLLAFLGFLADEPTFARAIILTLRLPIRRVAMRKIEADQDRPYHFCGAALCHHQRAGHGSLR